MKKKKTLNDDLLGLGRTSMTIGLGSMMMGVPGLNAPAGLKQSFNTAAGMMPIASAAMMTKHISQQVGSINKTKRKHRW